MSRTFAGKHVCICVFPCPASQRSKLSCALRGAWGTCIHGTIGSYFLLSFTEPFSKYPLISGTFLADLLSTAHSCFLQLLSSCFRTCKHTYAHICIHTHIHTDMYTEMHTYTHMHTQAQYVPARVHTHTIQTVHTHSTHMPVHMHTHKKTNTHTQQLDVIPKVTSHVC